MLRLVSRTACRRMRPPLSLLGAASSPTNPLAGGLEALIAGGPAAAAPSVALGRCFHASAPSFAAQAQQAEVEPATESREGIATRDVNISPERKQAGDYLLMMPVYDKKYMEGIRPRHKMHEKTAFWAVTAMRWGFDTLTGYPKRVNSEAKWLQRIVFLETVAGVPGMVGAMLRHLRSLRTMRRDHGWIHTLLEEAENERMHLLTAMALAQPGPFFRAFVLVTQGVFFNLYTAFYLISPKHCHAFVGYLEEEAVKTYSHCLAEIDQGALKEWQTRPPPEIGARYWGLGEGATMRDLILAIRADEYGHAHVNQTFSALQPNDDNPFEKGAHQVP